MANDFSVYRDALNLYLVPIGMNWHSEAVFFDSKLNELLNFPENGIITGSGRDEGAYRQIRTYISKISEEIERRADNKELEEEESKEKPGKEGDDKVKDNEEPEVIDLEEEDFGEGERKRKESKDSKEEDSADDPETEKGDTSANPHDDLCKELLKHFDAANVGLDNLLGNRLL